MKNILQILDDLFGFHYIETFYYLYNFLYLKYLFFGAQ